ncbi:MAG: glycosyltransferase family 4 protein [Chloroflexi bacterium]|nr:glycosyltransferase family 4 protein [Chloroflexota bacterium]
MTHSKKSVCLISSDINGRNLRLQPWRYLSEVARQLTKQGHEVNIITDGSDKETVIFGLRLHRIPTVSNARWQDNRALQRTIAALNPDVVLWHMGLTSLLHQQFDPGVAVPVVGIFTSPIYGLTDLTRIGLRRIVNGHQLSGIHAIGTLLPNFILRQTAAQNSHLRHLVVQTNSTGERLRKNRLTQLPISTIEPGVDEVWQQNGRSAPPTDLRHQLGYKADDKVVLYFGSPAPLRGLHTLVKAVQKMGTSIKLLILSRRHAGELMDEDVELRQLLETEEMQSRSQIISGYLAPERLVAHIAAADIVALPFELVPSDAPLSLLEAKALGKPVVTTEVACLPELVADGAHYLAKPADAASLAHALNEAAHDLEKKASISLLSVRRWQQVGEEWSHLIQTV